MWGRNLTFPPQIVNLYVSHQLLNKFVNMVENFIPQNSSWDFLLKWEDNFISRGLSQAFVHREWGMTRESILGALINLERFGQGASRQKPKSSWPMMTYSVVPVEGEGVWRRKWRSNEEAARVRGSTEIWWLLWALYISREDLWKFSKFCE